MKPKLTPHITTMTRVVWRNCWTILPKIIYEDTLQVNATKEVYGNSEKNIFYGFNDKLE